jgi:hypothetical protein
MLNDQIVFIIDLNELENGSELPVSMDYTVNAGARVLCTNLPRPKVDDWVMAHSDDDNTIFYAQVISVENDQDLVVRLDWESCSPVINKEWSAQDLKSWMSTQGSKATVAGKVNA